MLKSSTHILDTIQEMGQTHRSYEREVHHKSPRNIVLLGAHHETDTSS